MAKIVRAVNDISNIKQLEHIIELECVEFFDDSGKTRKFKLKGITPMSTEHCVELDENTDWTRGNFHFFLDKGDEVL